MAHKDNEQITIDNKRKTKVHNSRHIVDKWKRTDRDNISVKSVKKCLVINYTCKYHVLLDTSLLLHQHEMFNILGMFVCTLPGIAGIKTFKG